MNPNIRDGIYSYFVNKHGAFEYRRGWLRVPVCMFCGKEEKLGINMQSEWVNCFACGSHGDLITAIRKIEGHMSYTDIVQMVQRYPEIAFKPKRFDPPQIKDLILPPSYINIAEGDSKEGQAARAYMRGRGFSIEHISRRGLGYLTDPEDPHFNHIIIPFYQEGKLIYFQARRYAGYGQKYNNPPFEKFGVGKNLMLYNVDCLKDFSEVHVLEGALNAIVMGANAIALGSKKASQWQITQMIKSPVKVFNILLDLDAILEALNLASTLIPAGKSIRVVEFEDERDPADLGYSWVMGMTYSTRVINSYNELLKLKNEINDRLRSARSLI